MPYIKLSDGRIIDITKRQKEELEKLLSESQKRFISINDQIIQTTKIIGIFSEDSEEEKEKPAYLQEFKGPEKKEIPQGKSPSEKARNELLRARIYWTLRTGQKEMPKEVEEKILKRLEDFFIKNPEEDWADKEVYLDLIPRIRKRLERKEGFQSLKEMLPEKTLDLERNQEDRGKIKKPLNFKKI